MYGGNWKMQSARLVRVIVGMLAVFATAAIAFPAVSAGAGGAATATLASASAPGDDGWG